MHIGHNIRRLRDFRKIKQETMARDLKMTQQNYSRLEQQEKMEDEMLERISKIIDYPVDLIKNLDQEGTQNIFNSGTIEHNSYNQYHSNTDLIALYEEIVRLQKINAALLEKIQNNEGK